MNARVAAIWRHPIKAHGRERLTEVRLAAGSTLPGDRVWAVAHEASRAEPGRWSACTNFTRGAKAPQLMAITTRTEADGRLTLRHPSRPDLTFDPASEGAAFLAWVAPLMPAGRAEPRALLPAGPQGMTDSPEPWVALIGMGSHRALEARLQRSLSTERWRANLIVEGTGPEEERSWIGRTLRIGDAALVVREPIGRCLATAANPETGERDADTLGALESGWGHQQFGVLAEVTRSGAVAAGDPVRLA